MGALFPLLFALRLRGPTLTRNNAGTEEHRHFITYNRTQRPLNAQQALVKCSFEARPREVSLQSGRELYRTTLLLPSSERVNYLSLNVKSASTLRAATYARVAGFLFAHFTICNMHMHTSSQFLPLPQSAPFVSVYTTCGTR